MNSEQRSIWSMLCWPRAGRHSRRVPMQKVTFLVPIVLVAALAAGCGGGTASVKKSDVAVVGGVHINKADYDALIAQAQRSFKQQGRPFPKQGTTDYESVKGNAVTLLVQQAE